MMKYGNPDKLAPYFKGMDHDSLQTLSGDNAVRGMVHSQKMARVYQAGQASKRENLLWRQTVKAESPPKMT